MSFVGIANKFLNDNKVDKQTYVSLASQKLATKEIGYQEALYALYSDYDELLYIGWAQHITQRLGAHFKSYTNTHEFQSRIAYAKYTFRLEELRNKYDELIHRHDPELSVMDLEYFTIGVLNPRYNKARAPELRIKIADEEAY